MNELPINLMNNELFATNCLNHLPINTLENLENQYHETC